MYLIVCAQCAQVPLECQGLYKDVVECYDSSVAAGVQGLYKDVVECYDSSVAAGVQGAQCDLGKD